MKPIPLLSAQISTLPDKPGVYQFLGKEKEIIYAEGEVEISDIKQNLILTEKAEYDKSKNLAKLKIDLVQKRYFNGLEDLLKHG